ncbi:hypothetical protein AAGS40_23385 [Paraburkholderia sp. PREW-6R]|uniref:hypothetical protein n=1 Tax=Paraburkholderia sp. PREW-6R TaxID=3141544 RepID=UPI0031F5710E
MTDEAGEVRELTDADTKDFRPAAEVLPATLRKKLGVRGPQKAPTKKQRSTRRAVNSGESCATIT